MKDIFNTVTTQFSALTLSKKKRLMEKKNQQVYGSKNQEATIGQKRLH